VNLIDDYSVNRLQVCRRSRSKNQVQRFRGRDENVARVAEMLPAFPCGGVAGPNVHPNGADVLASTSRFLLDAVKGLTQVSLDVIDERFER
jgi:hypothetical protein